MRWILQRAFFQYQRVTQGLIPSVVSIRHHSYLGNWQSPKGYDCGIMVHNSAINEKVPLILTKKDTVTWYICGPTVYAESHIGHACCYVKFDIIRRIMEKIFGINILLLMGITDIDDKIIKISREAGISASEIAKQYEFEFFEDMAAMEVQPPTATARVTENIPLIIAFIEKLIENDFAYVTDEGNVYFIVSKSVSADILNEMPDDFKVIVDPFKKDKRDFALWKSAKPEEPFWQSPWGKGRPGWHIECSAMASDIFGSQLDIHSGGFDLLFPHHANEKSQSEAFHGCSQWVNFWLHSGLLQVGDDVKMSKSIQNTLSIKEFLKDNCVNDFRILCLQSLYRKNISYCAETIDGAKGLHKKLHNFVNECELYISSKQRILPHYETELIAKLEICRKKVVSFLADDFNTSQALLCLSDLIDEINIALESSTISPVSAMQGVTAVAACSNYVNHILETLGIKIMCRKRLRREFVFFIDTINEFRSTIRMFALCLVEQGNSSSSQFIDDAYQNVKASTTHVLKLEEYSQFTQVIQSTVNLFYKESLDFVSTLSPSDSYSLSNDKKILKAERKKRSHMLSLCDDLRSTLQVHGIAIKDKKDNSTWFPLMTLKF